jgi:hypothetical protein
MNKIRVTAVILFYSIHLTHCLDLAYNLIYPAVLSFNLIYLLHLLH